MLRATAAGDGPAGAPARARPRRSRFDGVKVAGPRWSGRRTLDTSLSLRRPSGGTGEGDDPVGGAAAEPQAGADAAGQDQARVHLSPRSRSWPSWRWLLGRRLLRGGLLRGCLLGRASSWPRSSSRWSSWRPSSSQLPSWPGFLAGAFLAAAFFAGALAGRPGSSGARPVARRPDRDGDGRRLLAPTAAGPWRRPLRGGGRLADRRTDHLLAGADGVLDGLADRADHGRDGQVRDVLDGAERVLGGHSGCPSGAGATDSW